MRAEKTLINDFYIGFWLYLLGTIAILIVILLLFLFRNKILLNYQNSTLSKIIFYCILLIIFLGSIFSAWKFILYAKDLNNVRNKDFEYFTGTVIGYTSIREGNSPTDPILGKPIFQEVDNGNKMTFSVGPTELGQTYTIIYLANTKIARIVFELEE